MEQALFIIILIIVILDFSFDRLLDYLNASCWGNKLPEELKDFYDQEKYEKSQDYSYANTKIEFIASSVHFVAFLLFLILGGFIWLDQLVRGVSENPIVMALLFFGAIGTFHFLISIPFNIYHTFVIEERFGFNKTTLKTYIFDIIIGIFLSILINGFLLALFTWFYHIAGGWFWLYGWMLTTVFSVFMLFFYSDLIVPLFNKQTPLEEGKLRDEIEKFTKKAGFKLDNIFVIDGSKRSSKANAYFTGFGRKKRIVLYDTLIKEYSTKELVAILAHEVGHYKKNHVFKSMINSIIQSGVIFFILSLALNRNELSGVLGVANHSFHIGVISFNLLYSPVNRLLEVWENIVSRKHEYEADDFAAKNFEVMALQEALKKLSVKNLSNLSPHPLYVFVNYSHPPLLKRLEHLKLFTDVSQPS